MPITQPTTTVEHEGEQYTFSYEALIECEHCERVWPSGSRSRRPTCSNCGYKTDRNVVGAKYTFYVKMLWSDARGLKEQAIRENGGVPNEANLRDADVSTEEFLDFTTGRLRQKANQLEAMVANGWEIDDVRNHRVFLSKDDFTEPADVVQN